MFYLYTHLGLGDIILCNGIIRNVCKKYDSVSIFCKPHYAKSVQYMLRDLKNLTVIIAEDHEASTILLSVPENMQYRVGHGALINYIDNDTFDACFYKQIGLAFRKRWDDFFLERDSRLEEEIYKKYVPDAPYAFVHDDIARGFIIDNNRVNTELKIVRPELIDNVFLYCKLIENASEIHCMDSCFKHIVDSYPIKSKLFYHRYIRGLNNRAYTQSRLNWVNLDQ